jgi:hypothetical protein
MSPEIIRRSSQMNGESELGQGLDKTSLAQNSFLCRALRHGRNLCKLPYKNKRSLFIFSEENIVRKYARMIIEWGYPFDECFYFLGMLELILSSGVAWFQFKGSSKYTKKI